MSSRTESVGVQPAGSADFPAHHYPWTVDHDEWSTGPSATTGMTLMVTVGSNASPNVLRTKLAHVSSQLPDLQRVTVGHLGIGHSAHVSRRGYLPAAPFFEAGAVTSATAIWVDDEQLAALDSTEPNYQRIPLRTTEHPLNSDLDEALPDHFDVYVSRHGVIGGPRPVPLGSQAEMLAWLGDRLADPALHEPVERVCARLAEPRRARELTERLSTAGLVVDDGLSESPRSGRAEVRTS